MGLKVPAQLQDDGAGGHVVVGSGALGNRVVVRSQGQDLIRDLRSLDPRDHVVGNGFFWLLQ